MKRKKLIFSIIATSLFAFLFSFSNLIAAEQIQLHSTLKVGNVTAGHTNYFESVNAKIDDVVKFEIWYHNPQPPTSGNNATNVNVKIQIPNALSKEHVAKSTVKGSNTNQVIDTASVKTEVDTTLEYVPGSAYRRYNKGTNENQNWVTEKISDTVTTTGLNITNLKPCFNFQETITVLARVKRPIVTVVKKVRPEGSTTWTTTMDAKAGDRIEYLITYKNEGNVTLNNLVVRDNLPKDVTFVPGTVKLYNGNFPNGKSISDSVIGSGSIVGNYSPGSNGHLTFKAMVKKDLSEGCHKIINVGVVRSDEISEYYNTAITNVCVPKKVTPSDKPEEEKPIITKSESLPVTGPVEAVAGTLGSLSLAGAGIYYTKGKKLLEINSKYNIFKK